MIEIFDDYCWTKQMKVITKDKHNVPGLGNFSYWNYTTSSTPSPMHYHSDIIEVHCMIKGKRFTQIEKNGMITKFISTGNQAFLSFPFELHSNGNQPQAPCEFYAFQIIVDNPYHMFGLNKEYSYELYKQLINLKHRHLQLGLTHQNHLRSAFNFFSDLAPHSIMIGVQFLVCFLFNLQFLNPVPTSKEKEIDPSIKASITFLNQNLCENLKLADLSEISGYSLSRFKVKFKAEIGITPAEYITLQKIDYAKKQLVETSLSITELSYSLGFSSSNYFCSVFKKIMNCTPQNYRKRYGIPSISKTKKRHSDFTTVKSQVMNEAPYFL
ncbi:MAG: helix-turn-helix transcriptional regulator [Lachnospiraceae bacterium]